jgi:phosphoglucomutase/phosphomannomutase
MINREDAQQRLSDAVAGGALTPSAADHIRTWLSEPPFAPYAGQVLEHIEQARWRELDDAFWTVIPFGTGGRRGKMYPIGTNAINDRTIGESSQGLIDYVRSQAPPETPLACAIAYDTRHRSEHFARLCAEIMAAAGVKVYFFNGFRSTPELSFAVRRQSCHCGIMVTASHNPPSDNAVKVYWSSGGQILPPHDQGVIKRVMAVKDIERLDFAKAMAAGRIVHCQDEIDAAYVGAVVGQALPGPRDINIVYSPLHGVGATAVCPVLAADGFRHVELYGPHSRPDGDFPNVPGHVANPENPQVFADIIGYAKTSGADVILASDPDCDRIGCAAPLEPHATSPWVALNGNQIGALLAEFLLSSRQSGGTLSADHYVVKTLVTTDLIRRIADAYQVKTYGDLLVGFRWIAGMMDQAGADRFVFGTEESHGYLAGSYCRDKDGALAAMLLAELAACLKHQGQTLHQKLEAIFWQYGAHEEQTVSVAMPGSQGMQRMADLMDGFRSRPPRTLGGLDVIRVRDYERGIAYGPGAGGQESLAGPRGDLVMLDLAVEGNYVAVRPSGTEPKVKYYMFTFTPPEQLADLAQSRSALREQLKAMESDLRSYSDSV